MNSIRIFSLVACHKSTLKHVQKFTKYTHNFPLTASVTDDFLSGNRHWIGRQLGSQLLGGRQFLSSEMTRICMKALTIIQGILQPIVVTSTVIWNTNLIPLALLQFSSKQ
jgi:hypothetical protein